MEDLTLALQLVGIELGVLIVALLIYIIVMFSRRYRAHRRAAGRLVGRLRTTRAAREQRRRDLLGRIELMSSDHVEAGIGELIRRENTLLSRILNALTGEDSRALESIDEDIHGLVAGYLALVADGINDRSQGRDELLATLRTEIRNISGHYRELKEENARLQAELDQVTGEYRKIYEREQQRRGSA